MLIYAIGCRIKRIKNMLKFFVHTVRRCLQSETFLILDRILPANPVNDRRVANAVTLKSTFRLP